MATRHEITSIQFKADAGKANAAIDSIRQKAKEANDQMTQLRQKLEEGKKANLPVEQIQQMEVELGKATKAAKQWSDAQKNLMRGVKALDEAIIQFNRGQGSVEKMSAALSKAARNAAQLQQSRMERGSEGWHEMEALITALDKNLVKARQDFDGLVQTIQTGGQVSVSELTSARQSLKELSDLTAIGSDEWKGYQAQLSTVSNYLSSISDTERRMAGEVVTVADAMKMANAATKEEAQTRQMLAEMEARESTVRRESAEGAVQLAKTNTELMEREIAATKEQMDAQRQLVGSIRALEDAESKAENETAAAETALQKQREETYKFTDAAWEAAKRVTELNKELEKLNDAGSVPSLSTEESADIDKQKVELQQKLADAQANLDEAKKAAEEPTRKLQEAEMALAEAQSKELKATEALTKARGNMDVGEEEQELDALERQHNDLVESLQAQKQAEQALAQAATEARQQETDAAIEMAQARNQSQEAVEQSIAVLEKAHKTTNDGTPEYEEQAEAIAKLKQRLAEMRGEVMSLADAEELAGQAMEEQAKTSKTGWAASTEELQRAEKTLADKVAKAKRGTKEEEAAYQKLVRQLQAVRTELNAGSMSGKQMMDVLANPKNVTSVDTLKAAIGRARQELDALGRRIDQAKMDKNDKEAKKLQKIYDELAKSVQQTDARMKELQSSSKATASAFDKAWSRLKTYVGLYVGAAVAMQKLTATLGDLMELSDRMGEVRKTTGFTADEVGRLSGNLAKLDTRTTLTQLMELSSLAGSVGLKTQEQVQGFTEAADHLIVALPEMGNESARTLIKIATATGDLEKNNNDVRETLEKVGSTIIALRANSASAAGPITDFVSRVGAVGAQAGISIDQIAALGSTIDALGGRVEMSATALSRMIPAIRNNAFGIAKAIDIPEKQLVDLFNQGKAMEAMVLIFERMRNSVKQFDTTTEEGMNAMANDVEALLGKNTTMREVMKELEQQGARAGIVFGLMSQNVDELKRQLAIASEAYRENTALANEFNNMNETVAARWQRLKNQVEESFVTDTAQKRLGNIVDMLRWIVDFLTGNLSPALNGVSTVVKGIIIAVATARVGIGGALSSMLTWILNLRSNVIKLTVSFKEFYAANKANVWFAIAAAVYYVSTRIYELTQRVDVATQAMQEADNTFATTQREISGLFSKVTELSNKQNTLKDTTLSLKEEEGKLQREVEGLRKKLGEGAEQSEQFRKKQEELEEAHRKVATAEGEASEATNRRLSLISEINSKYGEYLGYMLSEASTAETVATAHDLIVASLKEEMYWREQNRAFQTISEQHSQNMKSYQSKALAELGELNPVRQQQIMSEWQSTLSGVKYDEKSGGFVLENGNVYKEIDDALGALFEYFQENISRNVGKEWSVLESKNYWGNWLDDGFRDWTKESLKVLKETATLQNLSGSAAKKEHENAISGARANTEALIQQASGGKANNRQLAEAIVGISKNLSKYTELRSDFRQFSDVSLNGIADVLLKNLPSETRKAVESEINKVSVSNVKPAAPTKPTSPYGTYNRVTSPYEEWDADSLVTRRKEMLERVRALASGADVQAVLSEDAKFITEATRKNIKTTKAAIEWYNTERLKIQEALHEKHLTNTGDWKDETEGGRKRKPQFYESDYALAELDRYYSHRKELLEKAREKENMTEDLYNREAELLEQEHLAKRSKLRETFTSEDKKMIEQFRKWWATLAKTGDLDEVPWATVESEWAKATDAQWGANNRKAQEDLTKLQGITVKHLNAIAKIIDKERPYDGITANLRDNLTKMDILFADYQKNGPTEDVSVLVKAGTERLKFLLGEAETAYTSTIEDVLRRMGKAGMTAWAEEIRQSPDMQNALMAQLQTAYDAIQEAIKKEASLIKKQTDIWWADIEKGQTQSRKGVFERALSELGLTEDQVKRANSLIGAGQASQRVADKLAIKQMQVQLQMQETYYRRMRQIGEERIRQLEAQGKHEDAEHLQRSLNLSLAKEQAEIDKQRVAIANQLEESQNRLYTELKEWGDLVASSIQGVFEASNTGQADFYTEQAKKRLTGESTTGRYIVVENAGTEDASASYQTLSDQEVLDIEQRNAMADAWKKLMDDLNAKMNDTITDQLNAMVQNASIDANTDATLANTLALLGLKNAITGEGTDPAAKPQGTVIWEGDFGVEGVSPLQPAGFDAGETPWTRWAEESTEAAGIIGENQRKVAQGQGDADKKMTASAQSAFAKMTAAANMYGIAYQAMSNENLSATQKFEVMALQAVGNYAISALTTEMAAASAKAATDSPGVLGTLWKQLGWAAAPVFAIFTGLLGGLMGLATSKISKAKSEIAQATGASISAGRLATGMLTYAEGNVNEFTDPSTLTLGRQYNVDGADGKTYRARYMGKGAKTHITNGPEFHLVGEAGREAIIDAKTTRLLQMDETGIWRAIQTLYNGGGIRHLSRRGRGVAAFAEGNIDDFEVPEDGNGIAAYGTGGGMSAEQAAALQASIDRQSALLERLAEEGIEAFVSPHGPRGIVAGYDKYKKEASRYGVRY